MVLIYKQDTMADLSLKELIEKYEQGKCSEEEEKILVQYFDAFQQDEAWTEIGGDKKEEIHRQIFSRIDKRIDRQLGKKRSARSVIWRVAASVALIAGIGLSAYFLYWPSPSEVVMITKSTERGQRLTVQLPDGSKVTLNSGSRLVYPEIFQDQRTVTLTGEAFFDVEKDARKKFLITSGDISTTVLGTSFNVKAYPGEEKAHVTVVTGKVAVSTPAQKFELIPGQQATYNTQLKSLVQEEVDLATSTAWKEGILLFDGNSLLQVADRLERWYGVEIELDPTQNDRCNLKLSFDNLSLQQVLDQLAIVTGIEYEFIENQRVRIFGTGCRN